MSAEHLDTSFESQSTAESLPGVRLAVAELSNSFVADRTADVRKLLEDRIGEQYEIVRLLGRGGMGCVFLARERSLDRHVAIKVLNPDLAVADAHRERFRREARIAARLNHPGILALHSFGEIANLWYFVMSYVRGETLADRVMRDGALRWPEARRIFFEMADALDCAHRNGVVHRDIKPANILIESTTGRAILADFGISKIPGSRETITATGAVLGTPAYMSPEQVTGVADVDERSDIYSLGIVAYVMLTGREPFSAATAAATMYRRIVEDAPPIATIAPSVPGELVSLVDRCMIREREKRVINAASLKDALGRIAPSDGLPDAAHDLPSFGPYALLWILGWGLFAAIADIEVGERILVLIIAVIAPTGLVLHVWSGAGRGMTLRELARVSLWPPEWWTMWWPSAFRRPADLWSRLPRVSRVIRLLVSITTPALLALILARGRVVTAPGNEYSTAFIVAEWGLFAACAIAVGAGMLWTRAKGLTADQSLRLLIGPTLNSSGWNEIAVSSLLSPVSKGIHPPVIEPASIADLEAAIRDLIAVSSFEDEVRSRACDVLQNALLSIETADREVASLARDASQTEIDRLSAQLETLDHGHAMESADQKELRDLVQHQLDIIRRMESRRESVMARRAERLEVLRSLWTLLQGVRDAVPSRSIAVGRLNSLLSSMPA